MLQNENGPCPLLAAANALLLKKSIELPSNVVGANVVTIDQLINILAEKVLHNSSETTSSSTPIHGQDQQQHENNLSQQFAVQELLELFPSLQFGMDVNPKFTKGPRGVEYTKQLNAFDLLHVDLVHGWLIDPISQKLEFTLIGNQTYNQLVTQVIKGNEAQTELERIIMLPPEEQAAHAAQLDALSALATHGQSIHDFLQQSSHQLTQYGLEQLYQHVEEGSMVVFFRNNHFNTLTKHKGFLYLLVTDLGYATVDCVVWEKLDVIDGDTEYVSSTFQPPPPMKDMIAAQGGVGGVGGALTGEQLVANNAQSQADYQLALQLSRESAPPNSQNVGAGSGVGTRVAVPPVAPPNSSGASSITGAITAAANTFVEGTTSMLRGAGQFSYPTTTATGGGPTSTSASSNTASSLDRDLQAAQRASLESYHNQYQWQSYQAPPPSGSSSIPPSSRQSSAGMAPQRAMGSIARVPVGRPSPLAGTTSTPTVALGVPATLAPGQFPLHPQQVQQQQQRVQTAAVTFANSNATTATVQPTVVDSLSGSMNNMNLRGTSGINNTAAAHAGGGNHSNSDFNASFNSGYYSGATMPANNLNNWEDQDRLMAMTLQQQERHDDHDEASRQLAIKLEREEQQRLAQARSRTKTAPPPRVQPTAPPHRSGDEKCVIS